MSWNRTNTVFEVKCLRCQSIIGSKINFKMPCLVAPTGFLRFLILAKNILNWDGMMNVDPLIHNFHDQPRPIFPYLEAAFQQSLQGTTLEQKLTKGTFNAGHILATAEHFTWGIQGTFQAAWGQFYGEEGENSVDALINSFWNFPSEIVMQDVAGHFTAAAGTHGRSLELKPMWLLSLGMVPSRPRISLFLRMGAWTRLTYKTNPSGTFRCLSLPSGCFSNLHTQTGPTHAVLPSPVPGHSNCTLSSLEPIGRDTGHFAAAAWHFVSAAGNF
ncbi:hypothetical protein PTKIN_Ptkin03bG0241100 [Pterospermum kingtungense]